MSCFKMTVLLLVSGGQVVESWQKCTEVGHDEFYFEEMLSLRNRSSENISSSANWWSSVASCNRLGCTWRAINQCSASPSTNLIFCLKILTNCISLFLSIVTFHTFHSKKLVSSYYSSFCFSFYTKFTCNGCVLVYFYLKKTWKLETAQSRKNSLSRMCIKVLTSVSTSFLCIEIGLDETNLWLHN